MEIDETASSVQFVMPSCALVFTANYRPAGAHFNEYIDNGDGTHDYVCSVCGTVEIDNEAHTYVDGWCVCGAQEPAELITWYGSSCKASSGKTLQIVLCAEDVNPVLFKRNFCYFFIDAFLKPINIYHNYSLMAVMPSGYYFLEVMICTQKKSRY